MKRNKWQGVPPLAGKAKGGDWVSRVVRNNPEGVS